MFGLYQSFVARLDNDPNLQVNYQMYLNELNNMSQSGEIKKLLLNKCVLGSCSPGLAGFIDYLKNNMTPMLGGNLRRKKSKKSKKSQLSKKIFGGLPPPGWGLPDAPIVFNKDGTWSIEGPV